MTKMRAVDAAVLILEKEGATQAFGLPGAAINPFYSAMRAHGGIRHVLARHVEAASHMAEGYTRTAPGNIGICIGTSGPAGTDMITGLYSASADSIPILCITGQAPVAKLDKEDFQAVDIASIAKPVTKMAKTVLEAAQVPGVFQEAFRLMRDEPSPVVKPQATRKQLELALDLIERSERPLFVAGGGILNATAEADFLALAEETGIPVVPTLMGWGIIPDDHPLHAGMVGLQTSHRYGNESLLASDLVFGIGNRWANRHTGDIKTYTEGRKIVHVDIAPTQIGRVFAPDLGIVSDAGSFIRGLLELVRERKAQQRDYSDWARECQDRKGRLQRKTNFDNIPIKPQRVYQEMNRAFGPETRYVTTIGLSQIAGAQMLHVFRPRHWINAGQAGPLGWTLPAAIGVATADPSTQVVALSGDYDFQFLIEELAVGAQFRIPFVHVVVNNSYLGLIRQSQRGFEMDYHVSLGFDNINSEDDMGYGVDHVKVAEGLGCKAVRVTDPNQLFEAFQEAKRLAEEHLVPVVVEVILEKVTNISMGGASIAQVNEFEPIAETEEDAPTAIIPIGSREGAPVGV
ncbi:glyoxylate carboligase [Tessaracoccus lubricantis]|uniref:Glyoxylate carboligase n=1 Tax=Tessaracoccus lubricantis TaxID=545543 RepID=A0ABP9FA47_9ACTN